MLGHFSHRYNASLPCSRCMYIYRERERSLKGSQSLEGLVYQSSAGIKSCVLVLLLAGETPSTEHG